MTWNYRIVEFKMSDKSGFDDFISYEIHECYYDDDGKLTHWIPHAVSPIGESVEDLKSELAHMQEAFNKPILKESEMPEDDDQAI